jgi:small-conductance mechanosensitive channel
MITFNPLLLWAIALILGFPLLVIVLGEFSDRLAQRGKPLASTLKVLRDLVLPVLVSLLFIRYVLKLSPDSDWVKSVETLFWISVIHASLSLLNTLLFEEARVDTWRARVPKLLIDLSRLFLVLLGAAIVLATVWKADLAGLVTALGLSSIVIALALQDTLGSVMSGIALLFERPFSVGDWLRVGDLVGQVIDINWRSVRLQTFDREMVIIPHKLIGSDIIRNFSRPSRLHAQRLVLTFSYNDPPNLAKQVLQATALETQGILNNPPPQVFTISYDDFAITYEVKFFIEDYGELEEIRDRFVTRVWYAAQRNHLTIPFPIRTLYHFHGPTSVTKGTEKKFAEGLQSIPNFVPIETTEGLTNLTEGITLEHFGAGEMVLRQGTLNNALYVLISGQATMTTLDDRGEEQEILSLKTGEFFGEMSLFSNDPSVVSITSITDLEVMKLSPTIVNQLLDRQPSFARELSQILEYRRKALFDMLSRF